MVWLFLSFKCPGGVTNGTGDYSAARSREPKHEWEGRRRSMLAWLVVDVSGGLLWEGRRHKGECLRAAGRCGLFRKRGRERQNTPDFFCCLEQSAFHPYKMSPAERFHERSSVLMVVRDVMPQL